MIERQAIVSAMLTLRGRSRLVDETTAARVSSGRLEAVA